MGLIDQIPMLRDLVQGPPILLMRNGQLDHIALKRQYLSEVDLNRAAHDYGFDTYQSFYQHSVRKGWKNYRGFKA